MFDHIFSRRKALAAMGIAPAAAGAALRFTPYPTNQLTGDILPWSGLESANRDEYAGLGKIVWKQLFAERDRILRQESIRASVRSAGHDPSISALKSTSETWKTLKSVEREFERSSAIESLAEKLWPEDWK